MSIKLLFVNCLFLLPTFLFGQSLVKKLRPDKRYMPKDWEVYYTNIPISGGIRVGAMAFESSDKVVPASFFVKLPKHTQSMLCVEISSRDGRYQAKLPYSITSFGPGIYELDLPTHYRDELKNYTIRDITIITKIAKSCDEELDCYVLSAWNSPNFNNLQAYIYLNSEQYTELILTNPPSKSIEHVIQCEKIPETDATAYNCLCKISGYDLTKFSDIRIRRIVNRGPKRSYNFIDLPIRL